MKNPNYIPTRREVRQLVEPYLEEGWRSEMTNGGHIKMTTPNGLAVAFISSTPGDRRAIENNRRDLKRALQTSLAREATQQPPVPPEEKARREQKDMRNMQTMTHQPFRNIPRPPPPAPAKPLSQPIPRPVVSLAPAPEPKKRLFIHAAKKIAKEMTETSNLTMEEACRAVFEKYHVTSGLGHDLKDYMSLYRFGSGGDTTVAMAERAKKKEEKPAFELAEQPKEEEKKVEKAPPQKEKEVAAKPVRKAHTDKEIDEKLEHVRAVLKMPFDKDKKMTLIIDLLQELI